MLPSSLPQTRDRRGNSSAPSLTGCRDPEPAIPLPCVAGGLPGDEAAEQDKPATPGIIQEIPAPSWTSKTRAEVLLLATGVMSACGTKRTCSTR